MFCFVLFFPLKISLPVIIYHSEKMSQLLLPTKRNYSSHTKISKLIIFIHVPKIVLGLQNKLTFWNNLLMRKLKNLSRLVIFFLEHFFFCAHSPFLSFICYPVGDDKVVMRFLENRRQERGAGSWFPLLL